MSHRKLHQFANIAIVVTVSIFGSGDSAGLELSPLYVSRQPSFNDQIEDLAVIDILFTNKDIAWILTTGGLYRYDTIQAKKILSADQLDLDLDYNISQLRLLDYENQIGIRDQNSIMLVDPISLETDFVYTTLTLPHDCKPLESHPQIVSVQYDGPKCNAELRIAPDEIEKFRVNQTTRLSHDEVLLSTTKGLVYASENNVAVLDTTNSHFEDNFILSVSKLTENQFLIGTYKGLYFGYKNGGFFDKQVFDIPKGENITDFLTNDRTNELYLLTDRAIYQRDNRGYTEKISTFGSEARVLALHGDYLLTTFVSDQHCVSRLQHESSACTLVKNPEAIDKITSLVYSTQIESFIGTTLEGHIVRVFESSEGQFKLESIETTETPLSIIHEISHGVFLIGGVDKLSLVSIKEEAGHFKSLTKATISTQGSTIYDILPLKNHFLVATSKGILETRIDVANGQYELNVEEVYKGSSVLSINSTDTHLAFTTASSLWYSELDNPTNFKQLRIRNLFPNFEFEFGISGKTPDGKLVFGGSGGLLFWDGDTDISSGSPPLLNFTGFSVNGEELDLTIAAEEITSVELSHKAHSFTADLP